MITRFVLSLLLTLLCASLVFADNCKESFYEGMKQAQLGLEDIDFAMHAFDRMQKMPKDSKGYCYVLTEVRKWRNQAVKRFEYGIEALSEASEQCRPQYIYTINANLDAYKKGLQEQREFIQSTNKLVIERCSGDLYVDKFPADNSGSK